MTRMERDTMGEMSVPDEALYGASTARAILNFPVSGRPLHASVIQAYVQLKRACAEVNLELGRLEDLPAGLVVNACDRILGALEDPEARAPMLANFPVDCFQTGSGTSTNMNVNEVISNIACLDAGGTLGDHDPVHPNDHVNLGQSSNDTFPTAMQVAGAHRIQGSLQPALTHLAEALQAKAEAWEDVIKIGRTHLMDATPIRLGQEFSGYASQVTNAVRRAGRALVRLSENLPIGGTAVGTGLNTHQRFGSLVAARLAETTGIEFHEAANHFEAQHSRDCIVAASGELRTIAISLSKIAGDIRLMASGPRAGFGELVLPATQPGSSIMPGKVNPVICESVIMVVAQVIGHDAAIAFGAAGGTGSILELNHAMPLMANNLLDSIDLLANASTMFVDRCIAELDVDRTNTEGAIERSLMMCTALVPEIGYDEAARVAKGAIAEGRSIREYVLEHQLIDPARLDQLLDASAMTSPTG